MAKETHTAIIRIKVSRITLVIHSQNIQKRMFKIKRQMDTIHALNYSLHKIRFSVDTLDTVHCSWCPKKSYSSEEIMSTSYAKYNYCQRSPTHLAEYVEVSPG